MLAAQGSEEELPYDPCPPSAALPTGCIDGTRTCEDYSQFACSTGYCWSNGTTTDNQGIVNGLVENQTIEIGGTYTVTENAQFVNCTFKMRGGSRININPDGHHGLMTVSFEGCTFFGCGEMWQGIWTDVSNAPEEGFRFNFIGCRIEDAYIALNLDERGSSANKAFYAIYDSRFVNNHIGVSNLRRDQESSFNVLLVRNQFYQTADLAQRSGALASIAMKKYPLAFAGIRLEQVSTVVGVDDEAGENLFFCLTYGVFKTSGRVTVVNCSFADMNEHGINSSQGLVNVNKCRFSGKGSIGIRSYSQNFGAYRNAFSGNWSYGIHVSGNLNGQFMSIVENAFDITGGDWKAGIFAERPNTGFVPNRIVENHFDVSGERLFPLYCINLRDLVMAKDQILIENNRINVYSDEGDFGVYGFFLQMGNSDNMLVKGNRVLYHAKWGSDVTAFGIWTQKQFGALIPVGHVISENTVGGVSTSLEGNPLFCAFHTVNTQNIDFCLNNVNLSVHGFHFLGNNDISLRQNSINYHSVGVLITQRIGDQIGHGNQWSLDPDACSAFAAVPVGNPMNSMFVIPEGNTLPWLPPADKIDPDPTMVDWFRYEPDSALHYCDEMRPFVRELEPYDKEVVEGTSDKEGVELWDAKLAIYAKLLRYPELRPGMSPEADFFDSLDNSIYAHFAEVESRIFEALGIDSLFLSDRESYAELAAAAMACLVQFDAGLNLSDPYGISALQAAQRDTLLLYLASSAPTERAMDSVRTQAVNALLDSARTYNADISTAFAHESAHKALNDIRLRQLMGMPVTESQYSQLLAIVHAGQDSLGTAVNEAMALLGLCDQVVLQAAQAAEQEHTAAQRPARAVTVGRAKAMLVTPNPSTGALAVTLPNDKGGTLAIYNSNGAQVSRVQIAAGLQSAALDLRNAASGLYWATFFDGAGRAAAPSKFVISR